MTYATRKMGWALRWGGGRPHTGTYVVRVVGLLDVRLQDRVHLGLLHVEHAVGQAPDLRPEGLWRLADGCTRANELVRRVGDLAGGGVGELVHGRQGEFDGQ